MALPKTVQDQGDKARKLIEDINKTPEQIAEGTPVEEQAPIDQNEIQQPNPEDTFEAKPVEPVQSDGFQQKYETMKGKYDREVPRLNDRIKQLEVTVDNLNQLIVDINTTGRASAPAQEEEKPVVNNFKPVNAGDFEGYGDEVIDLVNNFNSLAETLNDLKTEVGTVKKNVATTAEERFYSDLAKAVPDWRTKNADLGWKQWLMERDDFSSVQRQALLEDAHGKLDAGRVAKIFKTYFNESPAENTESSPKVEKQNPLEEQVVPASSSASSGPVNTDSPTVTDAQYQSALVRARQGKITMDEFKQITRNYTKSKQRVAGR